MRYCVGWIAFSLTLAPVTVQAETFLVKDGTVVEGTVLRSLGNTLTIKRDNGGMFQLPLSSIERVEIAPNEGKLVTGSLAFWTTNMYVVLTSEGLVEIKDGVMNKVSDSATSEASAIEEPGSELEINAGQSIEAPAPVAKSLVNEQAPKRLEPTM